MIEYFKHQGLTNPYRVRALIEDAINFNTLDLVVFAEVVSMKNYGI